jgi:hypothetical protein
MYNLVVRSGVDILLSLARFAASFNCEPGVSDAMILLHLVHPRKVITLPKLSWPKMHIRPKASRLGRVTPLGYGAKAKERRGIWT